MHRLGRKDWARVAMKAGLLLTDAKLWAAVNDQIRDRAGDMNSALRQKYDSAASRIDDARAALQGQNGWVAPLAGFLGGLGVGIGVGMLLTPISGDEARAALRDRAVDVKKKVSEFASGAMNRATGTEGD